MPLRTIVVLLLRAAFLGRHALILENLALRQQLAVLKRKSPHPRTVEADRRFWVWLRALHDGWRECLLLVQPATVVRWHRQGFRWHWGRACSGHKQGRPSIGWKLFCLIRRLQKENPTWGAPRITSELRLLGHTIGQTTVSRYMKRMRDPRRSQTWTTFLRNHAKIIAACDFFTVPTVTWRNLFVLVVLSHDRRLIRHIAVTARPTGEWTARQIAHAFANGPRPQYLIHDRDPLFRAALRRRLQALAIEDRRTAPRQPWQNGKCERVIGTLRRECTDHLIVLNERHLLHLVREYVEQYYNVARPHLSLERNAPIPRQREATPAMQVKATPVLGGLHHRYERAA
jgi:transposase InsO family protein